MAVCIDCGLGEDGSGDGYVDLDPEGGLECNGAAGDGTPTNGRGIRIKSTNGDCNGLVIASDGTVTVTPHSFFATGAGLSGTNLSPESVTNNLQIIYDNTDGCETATFLFAVEFNLQSDAVSGEVDATGGYRINGGAWNDIYNIQVPTPSTVPFTFCPSVQTVAAGATSIFDVRLTNNPGSDTIDSWAIRLSVWGGY